MKFAKTFIAVLFGLIAAVALSQVTIQFPNGAPVVGQQLVFTNVNGQLGYYTPAMVSAVAPNLLSTSSYVVTSTDNTLVNTTSATLTLTLPTSASSAGRRIRAQTVTSQTIVSITSNVIPCAGGAAGTAILAATAGKWADLEADGASNWRITACN